MKNNNTYLKIQKKKKNKKELLLYSLSKFTCPHLNQSFHSMDTVEHSLVLADNTIIFPVKVITADILLQGHKGLIDFMFLHSISLQALSSFTPPGTKLACAYTAHHRFV